MHRGYFAGVLILCSPALGGCVETLPLDGGKALVRISLSDERTFLDKLGYPKNYSSAVSRSRSGDRLFIQFDDHTNKYNSAVKYKVAIISAEGIVLKDLPGRSYLNDKGEPVCWLSWQGGSNIIRFANGSTLAANEHWHGQSDGAFIPMFRDHEDHWWISRVDLPLDEIVTFDWAKQFQLLISEGEKLNVFVRGQPDGKPRRDRWFILKRYEYKVVGSKAELLRVQDFNFTWSVLDFDPQTGLMLARSWDTIFAHGILVNTVTGERRDLRGAGALGYFLQKSVASRLKDVPRPP